MALGKLCRDKLTTSTRIYARKGLKMKKPRHDLPERYLSGFHVIIYSQAKIIFWSSIFI